MAKKKKMPQAEYDGAIGVLLRLRAQFPNVISRLDRQHGRLPLKIGIHDDIVALLPEIDPHIIGQALKLYTSHSGYRRALVEGAPRVDLNGAEVGIVTAEAASHAATSLERFMRRYAANKPTKDKVKQAPAAKETKPAGIAGLRAAARARQSA
jgi:ProP effector